MPRERAHWFMLKEAMGLLPKDGVLACAYREHHNWALLGAVLPDAPYYNAFGKDSLSIEIAEYLHGREGQDTLAIMRRWGRELLSSAPSLANHALWLGALSHIVLDQEAHPLIFYFTGDYYDAEHVRRTRARTRHRLLEVYLDAIIPEMEQTPRSLSSILLSAQRTATSPLPLFSEICHTELQSHGALPESHRPSAHAALWHSSFHGLARIQGLLLNPAIGMGLRLLCTMGLASMKEFDALCAWGRSAPDLSLDSPLTYQNPVTGDALTVTLSSIIKNASKRLASLCLAFEQAAATGTWDDAILPSSEGRSLSFNLCEVRSSDARFFAPAGLPLEGLKGDLQ